MWSPSSTGVVAPTARYINQEFGQRVWVSTRLLLVATILSIVIGIALGVYSAARQYKFSDRVITGYSYLVLHHSRSRCLLRGAAGRDHYQQHCCC